MELQGGERLGYGALLLATGAEPVRLEVPGEGAAEVRYLRTFADSRALVARARKGARAVVVGASFIGLEVAAALRKRELLVDVVAPVERPLESVLGPELGDFVRELHEKNGVRFHLRRKVRSIGENEVTLDDGTALPADLVVAGIGVRPSVELAERAGLRVEDGVVVDAHLATSAAGIHAAGDIARWPDPQTGELVRVEHWVVAERLGQTAARNILGAQEAFTSAPFFWSRHYDLSVTYVGHAQGWEEHTVAGSVAGKSCLVAFRKQGRIAAVAALGRKVESLRAGALLERGDQAGLERLLAGAKG